jgi:bifunctional UDP-N-acetylglucosamine pyrophosphorylase/glucosamine-1-phosphate N-acetyltransferase
MSKGNSCKPPVAVILAAGKGTRMRSSRPKVLHEVAGKPLLRWVLDAAHAAGCQRCLVVVGHGSERVREAFADEDLVWVEQTEQRGTGHALAQVQKHVGDADTILVLSGDVPAVRPSTLEALLRAADGVWGSMTVAEMDNPGALGRVVMRDDLSLDQIVESADASGEQLALRIVNAGIYALPAPSIFEYLAKLEPDNAKGELYLTDALGDAATDHFVATLVLEDWQEALGINTRKDLARVQRVLIDRHLEELMEAGVTIFDPSSTIVEPTVQVGCDTEIHSNVSLLGDTVVGEGCEIQTGAWLRDSRIESAVAIAPYSVLDGAVVGSQASIGPFSRLRPGADIGSGARIGNFVEVKNSRLEEGVKAGHLAYLGDAEIGAETNIGAGVVICNYDGKRKHRTTIGRKAFIGSDTMLVAPLEVGDDAVTGAGSVITNDVPAGSLGVGRSRQRNIAGWSERHKGKDKGE